MDLYLTTVVDSGTELAFALLVGLLVPYVLAFNFVPAVAWAYRRTEPVSRLRAVGQHSRYFAKPS